ncbi:hypothetical protein D3C78_1572300 [compost metagenome]
MLRISIAAPLPGRASFPRTEIPCTLPAKAPAAVVEEVRTISSDLILLTAPEIFRLDCVP